MKKDFFVSYNSRDTDWAEWIAWILEEEGYTVAIQIWDFVPGSNFVSEMQKSVTSASKTIAVVSKSFLRANFTEAEWAAAFSHDPQGFQRKLIPIRVDDCTPDGLLKTIVYIDLAGCKDASKAKRSILSGVSFERLKPLFRPSFPGELNSGHIEAVETPIFPPENVVTGNDSKGKIGYAKKRRLLGDDIEI